jgi:hypothetical protein
MMWDFSWSPLSQATKYNLFVKHTNALNPVFDTIITGTTFKNISSGWTGSQV